MLEGFQQDRRAWKRRLLGHTKDKGLAVIVNWDHV